ncbi:MAG: cell division protein ZapA [Nitrospinae bacterium]|nr:cell division protein ZapA [Nitrospinota bacterium]
MAKIQIYGKTYNLKSSSGEISTEEVASFVDTKMRELAEARSKTPTLDIAVLAALNIAQELMELQKHTDAKNQGQEDKIGRLLDALEKELQAIDS